MFDQITETRIEPDGKVTVTDVPAEAVENAVADSVRSAREFEKQTRARTSRPTRSNPTDLGFAILYEFIPAERIAPLSLKDIRTASNSGVLVLLANALSA